MEVDSPYDASDESDEDDDAKALLEPIPQGDMSLGMHTSDSGHRHPAPPTPPTTLTLDAYSNHNSLPKVYHCSHSPDRRFLQ